MTSQPSDTPASMPTGPGRSPGGPRPVDNPTGPGERTARQFTDPLRQPAAFVLLAANGLILLFAVMDMLVVFEDWSGNFLTRAGSSYVDFVGIVSIGFPLLAVLLATHIKPRVPQARLITALALVEYGVSALFGALCLLVDFLHGVTDSQTTLGISPARRAFEDFLVRAGEFTVLMVAAFAVFQLFQALYASIRPVAANPPYGQPGYPPAYGQPGYPSAYGQPTYPSGFHPYGQQATGYGGSQSAWPAAQSPYGTPSPYGTRSPAQQVYPPPVAAPAPISPEMPAEPAPAEPAPPGEPDPRSESGPAMGDDAQATQPIQRPADDAQATTQPVQRPAGPEGPTQQWMRP
ncbi:MAG: hypothetical protein JWP76_3198 [Dactylosporangium sp.]|nr:hypothetical protein [Dactylosporangium sp.]